MKKLQNSLYINTQGAYLHKERETLVIDIAKEKALQLPIHSISGIFCFGNVPLCQPSCPVGDLA
jgi:CRISPR-associated protein Cas1